MRYRLSAPTHGPNGGVADTLDEAKVVSLGMGCAGPKREYWLGRLLWARLGAGLAVNPRRTCRELAGRCCNVDLGCHTIGKIDTLAGNASIEL